MLEVLINKVGERMVSHVKNSFLFKELIDFQVPKPISRWQESGLFVSIKLTDDLFVILQHFFSSLFVKQMWADLVSECIDINSLGANLSVRQEVERYIKNSIGDFIEKLSCQITRVLATHIEDNMGIQPCGCNGNEIIIAVNEEVKQKGFALKDFKEVVGKAAAGIGDMYNVTVFELSKVKSNNWLWIKNTYD